MQFYNADCEHIAIENPPPMRRFELPKYTQIITPNMFGEPVGKKTALWLKNLPILKATDLVPVSKEVYKWVRHCDGRIMTCSKWYSKNGGKYHSVNRSKTFIGIANAFAEQWGVGVLLDESAPLRATPDN